jgi:2-desacetyl-2-hydroxyethyl bacteriochlorophyllide A dehydrogenase
MPQMMRFTAPRAVDLVDTASRPLRSGEVRLRTIASGISAGTELTAYRGTNPYLTSTWDPELRLFRDAHPDTPAYPLEAWGYSEVGEVIEVAPGSVDGGADAGSHDDADSRGRIAVGDIVWGVWGHRSEGVVATAAVRGHQLPAEVDPVVGCFVRVGAIALNAVLEADAGIGDVVVVFGQGVIGLLATHFATMSGSTVIAVDGIAARRDAAILLGAAHVLAPGPDTATTIRALSSGRGADVAIELSGSYQALREAIRAVGPDSTVVAAGFYQGPATPLLLGEEFHHNRIRVVASQIGAVPGRLHPRWDRERLQATVAELLARGRPDVLGLISHRFSLSDAADAFRLLDEHPDQALQVILDVA